MIAAAQVTASASQPPVAVQKRPHAALSRLLDELASVLSRMPAAAYTAKPFPAVSGSIGQHVRHILDHVAGVCAAAPHGVLTYDRRERGTDVEAGVSAALGTIVRLKSALDRFEYFDDNAPVTLASVLAHDAPPVAMRSTLAREIQFVISHTIHHQALIAVLLSATGCGVPDTFGLAPSTPLSARQRVSGANEPRKRSGAWGPRERPPTRLGAPARSAVASAEAEACRGGRPAYAKAAAARRSFSGGGGTKSPGEK